MSSNLIQPTKPRQKENTHKTSCSRKCPSAISSSHYCISHAHFSLCRFMWPFLGLAQVRREFSESREIEKLPSPSLLQPPPPPTSLLVSFDNYFLRVFSFSFIIAVLSFSLGFIFFYPPVAMSKKKMKAVALDSDPCLISEDARSRFRYQSLQQDYRLLMKKMDSTRKHLEKMKQKKLILLAEVHFLRRRYVHLLKNQVPSLPLVQETAQSQKWEAPKRCITEKGKKHGGKRAASRPPVPGYGISKKEWIYNGKQAAWGPPVPSFEVNQKGGSYSGKDVAELQRPVCTGKEATLLRNASPILDINQNDDRVYSGKEASQPNRFRAFDLNQISREEEELQADPELAIMESPANFIRGSDEQYADMKLSVCRNIGTSSSGAGKRKISWQDPVVLRV